MQRTFTMRLLGAVASLFLASAGHAIPIDDFEQGSFSLTTQTSTSVVVSGLSPLHSVAPQRTVQLNSSAAGFASAQLDVTNPAPDHEIATVFPPGGGTLTLGYALPSGVDLTGGGQLGIFFVDVSVAVPGAELTINVVDEDTASGQHTLVINGPGFLIYDFADFGGVDFTRVVDVRVLFETAIEGDYHFADIRITSPVMASPIGFTLVAEGGAGPPYPTGPVRFDGTADPGSGDPLLFETVELVLQNAVRQPDGEPVEVSFEGEVSTPPSGPSYTGLGAIRGRPVGDAFSFEMLVDIYDHGTYSISLAQPAMPETITGAGFRLPLRLRVDTLSGDLIGYARHDLLVEVPEGAAFEMSLVSAGPVVSLPFSMAFDLTRLGSSRVSAAGFSTIAAVRVTGELGAAPTVSVESVPAVSGDRLRAAPSVTARGTTFSIGGTREHESAVSIFDIGGRSVRTLTIGAGERSVSWDGRDGGGRDLAPGVYVARVRDGRSTASSRVVIVE